MSQTLFFQRGRLHGLNWVVNHSLLISKEEAGISETRFWWSRPRPRLEVFESQCRYRERDWIFKSLNVETDTETKFLQVSVSILRPRLNFCGCRDRDSSRLGILWLSRPRLIETGNFCGCFDDRSHATSSVSSNVWWFTGS